MKDRHITILNLLNEKEQISVQELADVLQTSMVTVRKDLEELETKGLLKRMHGFASKVPGDSINFRMVFNYAEKKLIAQKAAEMIAPLETIMIESGSTCALFALEAASKKDATIITNSVYIARYVNQVPNAKVILLGGDFDTVAEVTTGPVTRLCAQEYHVDKLFVGIDGFTEEAGFTTLNHTRGAAVRVLAARADKVITLTTSEKFGRQSVARLFSADEVHTVITDDGISPEHEALLHKKNIQVVTVNTTNK